MLWRLLFVALIGGAQLMMSDRCRGSGKGQGQCRCRDSAGELIQTTFETYQSSTGNNNHPEKAIDENTTTCAMTSPSSQDHGAWWTVELPAVYQISCVSIFSKDLTGTVMNGAAVQIRTESYNNDIDCKMCAHITNFTDGEWNDFRCTEPVSGRSVNVFLPGTSDLILCEVKIYGKRKDLINTASSITSQSSDYIQGVPFTSGRATDGDETLCAITKEEQGDHWWRIDLLGVSKISGISIYNKEAKHTNITGAQIHVGNSLKNNGIKNKKCTNITKFIRGQWNDFRCTKKVSGRYVTVFFPGARLLFLCEVEIYGRKKVVESKFKLIRENKTWEHALEHCRERNMDLATILNEDDQTLAELEARRAQTPYLWLGLHYTCILEVWFWVADHRLEFNRWADGQKTGDCDRSAVMSRAEDHQWFSKSDYDEFNFICQKL